MPPYKVTYFKARGRVQTIKYLCIANDIALEEEFVEDWVKMKPTLLFGQVPVLYDGKVEIGQSNAILRHLARVHGLYGKDELEATTIDVINDTQEDLRTSYGRVIWTDQNYDTEKENFIKGLPEKLTLFEKALSRNNGGSGFFVGSKVSFADYNMFDILDNLITLAPHCLDSFPLLKAFHGRIAASEKIAKYRASDAFKTTPINGNGRQ